MKWKGKKSKENRGGETGRGEKWRKEIGRGVNWKGKKSRENRGGET